MAITLDRLTKFYGKSRGIEDLSFTVEPGEVFGFLGPNGSGKTTTLRTLMGLIDATSGSATILGRNALLRDPSLRAAIGYLPGALELYQNLTGRGMLTFLAKMRGVDCTRAIEEYAERLDLDLDRHIHDHSKGNRQKIGVIQAFMHQPDVLLLDEPTSGLDPLVQREFEVMLHQARDRGAATILSSHVLSEVEHLADRVAIINNGTLVVVEHISTLKDRAVRTIDLFFDAPVSGDLFTGIEGVKQVTTSGRQVSCTLMGAETALLAAAVAHGVQSVRTREPSLEEIFVELIS